MKLVAIEDVRVGQIWQCKEKDFIMSILINKQEDTHFIADGFGNENCYRENMRINKERLDKMDCKLTGFINITHKKENNKLVEIPRKEFEVDRIIQNKKSGNIYQITKKHICGNNFNNNETFSTLFDGSESWTSCHLTDEYLKENFEEIGDLNINYEWKNDKLLIKE